MQKICHTEHVSHPLSTNSLISKKSPKLPLELMAKIISFLDACGWAYMNTVSHEWRQGLRSINQLTINTEFSQLQARNSVLNLLKNVTKLRALKIDFTSTCHLQPLGEMTQLYHLDLGKCSILGDQLTHLSTLTKLRSLRIDGSDSSWDSKNGGTLLDWKNLCVLNHLPLEKLTLKSFYTFSMTPGRNSVLKTFNTVRSLTLEDCTITSLRVFTTMVSLASLTFINCLELDCVKFSRIIPCFKFQPLHSFIYPNPRFEQEPLSLNTLDEILDTLKQQIEKREQNRPSTDDYETYTTYSLNHRLNFQLHFKKS